jgi:prefoldin subunit 5
MNRTINFTDASAPERLRNIASDLEKLNTRLQELISAHEQKTQENTGTQERIKAEIKSIREAIETTTDPEPTLTEASQIDLVPIPTLNVKAEVTPETIIDSLDQLFRTAYETVIMTLNEKSTERIAYAEAFNALKSPTASIESKRDKVNEFIKTIDKSKILTMDEFNKIYIEVIIQKKTIFGKETKAWNLNPDVPLDEVFTKIKIVKAQK